MSLRAVSAPSPSSSAEQSSGSAEVVREIVCEPLGVAVPFQGFGSRHQGDSKGAAAARPSAEPAAPPSVPLRSRPLQSASCKTMPSSVLLRVHIHLWGLRRARPCAGVLRAPGPGAGIARQFLHACKIPAVSDEPPGALRSGVLAGGTRVRLSVVLAWEHQDIWPAEK